VWHRQKGLKMNFEHDIPSRQEGYQILGRGSDLGPNPGKIRSFVSFEPNNKKLFEIYLRDFTRIANARCLSNKQKFEQLVTRLEGSAKEVYNALPRENRQTWNSVLQGLKKNLEHPPFSVAGVFEITYNGYGGDLERYYFGIHDWVQLAAPAGSWQDQEKLMVSAFLRGLPQEMRGCIYPRYDTLAKAYNDASTIRRELDLRQGRRKVFHSRNAGEVAKQSSNIKNVKSENTASLCSQPVRETRTAANQAATIVASTGPDPKYPLYFCKAKSNAPTFPAFYSEYKIDFRIYLMEFGRFADANGLDKRAALPENLRGRAREAYDRLGLGQRRTWSEMVIAITHELKLGKENSRIFHKNLGDYGGNIHEYYQGIVSAANRYLPLADARVRQDLIKDEFLRGLPDCLRRELRHYRSSAITVYHEAFAYLMREQEFKTWQSLPRAKIIFHKASARNKNSPRQQRVRQNTQQENKASGRARCHWKERSLGDFTRQIIVACRKRAEKEKIKPEEVFEPGLFEIPAWGAKAKKENSARKEEPVRSQEESVAGPSGSGNGDLAAAASADNENYENLRRENCLLRESVKSLAEKNELELGQDPAVVESKQFQAAQRENKRLQKQLQAVLDPDVSHPPPPIVRSNTGTNHPSRTPCDIRFLKKETAKPPQTPEPPPPVAAPAPLPRMPPHLAGDAGVFLQVALLNLLMFCLVPAEGMLAGFNTRVGSIIDTAHGVAILPRALMVSSSERVYVPIILTFLPPNLGQHRDGSEQSDREFCSGPTCSEKRPCAVPPQVYKVIENFHSQIAGMYAGLVDTPYYSSLLTDVCRRTPGLCDMDVAESGKHKNFKSGQPEAPQRVKRFVRALLAAVPGIAALGMTGWGRTAITETRGAVAALEKNLRFMNLVFRNQEKVLKKLSAANGHVYSYLHATATQLQELIQQVGCRTEQNMHRVENILLQHMVSQQATRSVERAIEAALSGRISAELINVTTLRGLFKQEGIRSNNVLSHEPQLVYQFGKLFPVSINLKRLHFAFIMELPVIHRSGIHNVFEIENTGWNVIAKQSNDSFTMRLNLPTFVAYQPRSRTYLALSATQCERKPGLWFCPAAAWENLEHYPCLKILTATSQKGKRGRPTKQTKQQCEQQSEFRLMRNITEVRSTLQGILARTHHGTYSIAPLGQGRDRKSTRVTVPPNGVIWLEYTSFSHVIIGDSFISTRTAATNILTEIIRPTLNYSLPLLTIPPLEWIEIAMAEAQNRKASSILDAQKYFHLHIGPHRYFLSFMTPAIGGSVGTLMLLSVIGYCYQKYQGGQAPVPVMGLLGGGGNQSDTTWPGQRRNRITWRRQRPQSRPDSPSLPRSRSHSPVRAPTPPPLAPPGPPVSPPPIRLAGSRAQRNAQAEIDALDAAVRRGPVVNRVAAPKKRVTHSMVWELHPSLAVIDEQGPVVNLAGTSGVGPHQSGPLGINLKPSPPTSAEEQERLLDPYNPVAGLWRPYRYDRGLERMPFDSTTLAEDLDERPPQVLRRDNAPARIGADNAPVRIGATRPSRLRRDHSSSSSSGSFTTAVMLDQTTPGTPPSIPSHPPQPPRSPPKNQRVPKPKLATQPPRNLNTLEITKPFGAPLHSAAPLIAIIHLRGTPHDALIDTGSNSSLISAETARKLRLHFTPSMPGTERPVTVASLDKIPVIGRAILFLTTTNGIDVPCEVLIVEKLAEPIIIGTDFLETMSSLELDFNNSSIRLSCDERALKFVWKIQRNRHCNCSVSPRHSTPPNPKWRPMEKEAVIVFVILATFILLASLITWAVKALS
jgi:hypothetical protein